MVHAIQPAVVSLTQLTEVGTAYTPEEIREISAIAHRFGLLVHMDGARFANAVVTHASTFADMSWKSGIDVLTLGTTKSGTFGAEVVITFKPELARSVAFVRKRSGHFAPTSRFLSAQVEAYLDNELWRRNATNSNAVAAKLANGLAACSGVRIVHPTEGNEVFAVMPHKLEGHLVQRGFRFHRNWRPEPRHRRFVMSWAARAEDIDALHAAAVEFARAPQADWACRSGGS